MDPVFIKLSILCAIHEVLQLNAGKVRNSYKTYGIIMFSCPFNFNSFMLLNSVFFWHEKMLSFSPLCKMHVYFFLKECSIASTVYSTIVAENSNLG